MVSHLVETLLLTLLCLVICLRDGNARTTEQPKLEETAAYETSTQHEVSDHAVPVESRTEKVANRDTSNATSESPDFKSTERDKLRTHPVAVADVTESSEDKRGVSQTCEEECFSSFQIYICESYGKDCSAYWDRKSGRCVAKCVNSTDSEETESVRRSIQSPDPNLRPIDERECQTSGLTCKHGKCTNSTSCSCDRGYIGPACDEQECYLPCAHGVCYSVSSNEGRCHCEPGWAGLHCNEKPCTKRCENNGACIWMESTQVCTCQAPWTGHHCEEQWRTFSPPSITLALAVGIVAPILCILMVIISWYILWRKQTIFVFKIINMFKAYEDDDDKVYDAYVSLTESETDYLFVKRVLQPRLEDMGHRLYLHARDGEVGVKSEEILKAVERSRRCILLLSADFISNEWCRFEYLLAQHETCIKLKQRIIPILIDDIDKDKKKMDTTLRFIVDSVKCLRYPAPPPELSDADGQLSPVFMESGHHKSKKLASFEKRQARFWERLRLSMPKKRGPFEVTSPTLSCNSECPFTEHVHYNNKKGVRLFLDNIINLFPFGNSSQKVPSMGRYEDTRQNSMRGQTQDIPSVSVVSPSVMDGFNLDSVHGNKSNSDSNKCGGHNTSSDIKSLRLEIPS